VTGDSLSLDQKILTLADPVAMDSLSSRYNRSRMDQVMNYLKSKRDSTVIIIKEAEVREPKNTGSQPIFDIKYSMLGESGFVGNDSIPNN
jgi:hypothetical protein